MGHKRGDKGMSDAFLAFLIRLAGFINYAREIKEQSLLLLFQITPTDSWLLLSKTGQEHRVGAKGADLVLG